MHLVQNILFFANLVIRPSALIKYMFGILNSARKRKTLKSYFLLNPQYSEENIKAPHIYVKNDFF